MSVMDELLICPRQLMASVGEAMNLLNEVANLHPDAVSLAAGRPAREYVRLVRLDAAIKAFVAYLHERGRSEELIWQYGPTAGIIRELVSECLLHDEGMRVDPRAVLLTCGVQEGMLLVLSLFDRQRDVLLVPDPTYVGVTGAAAVAGVGVSPLKATALDAEHVRERVEVLAREGLRARALYLVPDFSNPLGDTMPVDERARLVELAHELDLWLIEDSPYRAFYFDEPPPPSLLAMDGEGVVIQLGSFAKTLSPGLRLAYLVWPSAPPDQWQTLVATKSFTTLNTSPVAQALAAGALLQQGTLSLRHAARQAKAGYRARMDAMVTALEEYAHRVPGMRWTVPKGGFFLSVELPFELDAHDMAVAAQQHRVLICPMSLFSPTGSWRNMIRLSYSYVRPEALHEGVRRLTTYLHERCL